jgi:hypothetical protein
VIPDITIRGSVHFPKAITTGILGRGTTIVVVEECFKHTLIIADFAGHPKYAKDAFRSGQPMVAVMVGKKGGERYWHGYVDSLVLTQSDDGTPLTKVIGAGITYPMKATTVDVGSGSVMDIQRRLIRRHDLASIVRGPDVVRQVLMGGSTDWQMLCELAQAYNQYVFTTGTTVNVLQMSDIVDLYKTEAVELVWKGTDGEARDMYALRKFRTRVTDNVQPMGLSTDNRIGYGVDPVTSGVTRVEIGESMFSTYKRSIARSSQGVVANILGSSVVSRAHAEGRGHTGVSAGKLIQVRNSEPGPWWFVNKVTHKFTLEDGDHAMELELYRTADLNMPSTKKPAQRNPNKQGDYDVCVCQEYDPLLHELEQATVQGTNDWTNGFRWRSRPC